MSCSPSLNDYSSEDFCNKEELVVFNVPFLYPPGSDIIIRYTLGSRVNATPLDWIGIFQSGFQSTCHPLTFQWATVHPSHQAAPFERIATFPAKIVQALESKDASYQFAYVSKDNIVLGCSQDFMLKHDDTWDMDMEVYDLPANRSKKGCWDRQVPHSDSPSDSPDLLLADEEWEFANQSSIKPESPSLSDLSDIVVLSTSPSKEAAKLLLIQAPQDNEKCILKSFSFSSDESSDEIIEICLDKSSKRLSESLFGLTQSKEHECVTYPVSTLPQDTISCFGGASPDKKPTKKVPMKSKIARIQKKTEIKRDKVKDGPERLSPQYPHSIYSKFKFVDDDSNSDDDGPQIGQTQLNTPIAGKQCLIQELGPEAECAEKISDESSRPNSAKSKKAKKGKSKKPNGNNDEVLTENELNEVSTKTPEDSKKRNEVSKKSLAIVFDELEERGKDVKTTVSKKVLKCRKKQAGLSQIANDASQVEKTGDKAEVEIEKMKEKLNMKVSRQLERKSKRSCRKCQEPIVTDEQVDNHMEIYSTDAKRAKPAKGTPEVSVQSVVKPDKEIPSECQAPGDEISSIKQKYIYSKKGRSKKKKRQQAKLKAQVLYNLEPLFGGAPPEEQQHTVTEVPKSNDDLELINSFVLQDTSDQGFPALPSCNKLNNVWQPPTVQTLEPLSGSYFQTKSEEKSVFESSTSETNPCAENPSNVIQLGGDQSDRYPDLKYLNIPAYLLDIMDALPAPRAECDDSSLDELKRAIPPHLTRASLQHFKAKYKLKYTKRHELQKMKLKGRYLNPCFLDCIKNNLTRSTKNQKNIFVLQNSEASPDSSSKPTIPFSTDDAVSSPTCPEAGQTTETASNVSLPQPHPATESNLPHEHFSEPKEPLVQLEMTGGKKLPLSYASVVKKYTDASENKVSCAVNNMNPEEDAATGDTSKQSEKVTINEFLAEDDQTLDEPLLEPSTKPVTTRSAALKTLAKVLKRRTWAMEEEITLPNDKEETGAKDNTSEICKEDEIFDVIVNQDQSSLSLFWPMPCEANVSSSDHLVALPPDEGPTIVCPSDQDSTDLHIRPTAKVHKGNTVSRDNSPPWRAKGKDDVKESFESAVDEQAGQDDPKAVLDLALATSLVENNFLKEKVAALESQLKEAEEELQRCKEEACTVAVPVRKSKTVTHRRVPLCKWTDNVKNLVRSNVEIFSLKSKLKDNIMEIKSLENQVNTLKEAYNAEVRRVTKVNMKLLKMKLKHKDVKAKLRAYETRDRLLAQAQEAKQTPDDDDGGNDSADYEPPSKRRRVEEKRVSNALNLNDDHQTSDVHQTSAPTESANSQTFKQDEPVADSLCPDATEPTASSSNTRSSSVSDTTLKNPESITGSPQYLAHSYHMSRSCTPKYARVKTDLCPATPVSGWPSSYSSSPPAYLQSLQAYLPQRPAYTNTTGNWYNPFPNQGAGKQMKKRTSPPHLPLPYPTITSPPKQLFQPCFPYARRKSPFQQPHFCSIQSPPQSNSFQYRSDQSPKRRSPPLLPLPFPKDVQSVSQFRDSSVSPPRQKRYSSRSPSGCNRHLANKHGSNDPNSINFRSNMNHSVLHYPPSPVKSVMMSHAFSDNGIFTQASNPDHLVPDVLNSHLTWGSRQHGSQGAWYDPSENSFINSGYVSMCGKHCGGVESGHKAKACVAPFQSRKDLPLDTTICPPPNGFMLATGTLGSPSFSNLEQNQRYNVFETNRANPVEYSDRSESHTQPNDCAGRYEIGKTQIYQDPVLPQALEIPPGAQFQSHFLRNLIKKEVPNVHHLESKNFQPRDPYAPIHPKTESGYYRQHQNPVTNYPSFSHPTYGALDQRPQSGHVYPYSLFQNGSAPDDQTHYTENMTLNKSNQIYERKCLGPNQKNGPVPANRYPDWSTHTTQQYPVNFHKEKSVVELIGYPRENMYRTAQPYETSVDKRHIEASDANHHIA
ncbi:unnamed protein product [Lymnaea stagnalis]|uniref:SKICH domain-containing protein n=1 Tax=Lymnaea stagnalis TaxID=6523 RepID=A0AAV2HBS8_LYMST